VQLSSVVVATLACGDGDVPLDLPDAGPGCTTVAALQWGGPGYDAVLDLHFTGDGVLIVAGYDGASAPDRFIPEGPSRGFVTAFDREGDLAWEHVIDSPGTDSVDAVASHDGIVYAAGHTSGALASFTQGGQRDLFLARLTDTVEILDQQGDERPQRPRRLLVGADEIVVAGMEDIYVPTNYVESWQDPMLVRWNRDGSLLARTSYQTWDTSAEDWFDAIVPAGDGDVIASGTSNALPDRGAFVTRIGPDGTRRWTTQLSPAPIDNVAALLPGSEGRVLAIGSTSVALAGSSAGGQDVYLAEIDVADGELLAAAQVGSSDADWVTDATMLADGTIAIAGETLGALVPGADTPVGLDLFVLVLGADGTPLAGWQGGTESDEHPSAVISDSCGQIYLGGWTRGDLAGASRGEQDGFVIPVSPVPWP